jgi:hypothetical protein
LLNGFGILPDCLVTIISAEWFGSEAVELTYKDPEGKLRNKTPKRRVKAKLRSDRTTAVEANDIWAMDFVHDQLFDGTKIRALTIIDTLTRPSPAVRAIAAKMLLKRLSEELPSSAIPGRSASTTVRSL